jgi:hypothetical protein
MTYTKQVQRHDRRKERILSLVPGASILATVQPAQLAPYL